nr:hypothetical protein GCM10020092_015800 [Actinoplanes digitatis]
MLERFGIASHADVIPPSLSSGQKQRLTLALALLRPSRLLILDEPEQRLDPQARTMVARPAARLSRRRRHGADRQPRRRVRGRGRHHHDQHGRPARRRGAVTTTVAVGSVRRWVRRTRSAHRERGETLGNFYFAVLFVAIVGGMLHRQLAAIFWLGRTERLRAG